MYEIKPPTPAKPKYVAPTYTYQPQRVVAGYQIGITAPYENSSANGYQSVRYYQSAFIFSSLQSCEEGIAVLRADLLANPDLELPVSYLDVDAKRKFLKLKVGTASSIVPAYRNLSNHFEIRGKHPDLDSEVRLVEHLYQSKAAAQTALANLLNSPKESVLLTYTPPHFDKYKASIKSMSLGSAKVGSLTSLFVREY